VIAKLELGRPELNFLEALQLAELYRVDVRDLGRAVDDGSDATSRTDSPSHRTIAG
jgi:hypothetical protein